MGGYAWVTLATNDAYSLGALVLAHSLRRVGSNHDIAILITPGVTQGMREKLSAVFTLVQEVNVLDSKDEANLTLLKRPELGVTFTKLHCWRLTQYEKCVFLDADTLVVRNCDELFQREELSAAPDVGWPDCFNSGVFVFVPSEQTFTSILTLATEKGSFDGGDQGVLNLYFNDWAHKDISKHLPFMYNMCSTAVYSYLPAFKQFGENVRIIHFIGETKPWLQYFDTLTGIVQPPSNNSHLQPLLQLWWNIFCEHVFPRLSPTMGTSTLAPIWHDFISFSLNLDRKILDDLCENSTDFSEFRDPWVDYCAESDPFLQTVTESSNSEEQQQYYAQQDKTQIEQQQEDNDSWVYFDEHVVQNACINERDVDNQSQSKVIEEEIRDDPRVVFYLGESIDQDKVEISDRQQIPDSRQSFTPCTDPTNLATHFSNGSKQSEHSGLAGALATMTLGEPRSTEQSALEEHMRKQSWEYGNIDYLGRDSFENIWKKINETLSQSPQTQVSQPQVEPELQETNSELVETSTDTTEDDLLGLARKALSQAIYQPTMRAAPTAKYPQEELTLVAHPKEEEAVEPSTTSEIQKTIISQPEEIFQTEPSPVSESQENLKEDTNKDLADSAVPIQVAESVLQPEPKESVSEEHKPINEEALSSIVAPVRESAAAISETVLEPSGRIELSNSSEVGPKESITSSNGFVEPAALDSFSYSSPTTERIQSRLPESKQENSSSILSDIVAGKIEESLSSQVEPKKEETSSESSNIIAENIEELTSSQIEPKKEEISSETSNIVAGKIEELVSSQTQLKKEETSCESSNIIAGQIVELSSSQIEPKKEETSGEISTIVAGKIEESVSSQARPKKEETSSESCNIIAGKIEELASSQLESKKEETSNESSNIIAGKIEMLASSQVEPKKEETSSEISTIIAGKIEESVSSQARPKKEKTSSESCNIIAGKIAELASSQIVSKQEDNNSTQKLEVKIPQVAEKTEKSATSLDHPESAITVPSTPTVIEATPPTSPPVVAEEKKPEKKKLVKKSSEEGENSEGKKSGKKITKKVIKKCSSEEGSEGSSSTSGSPVVKKVSKGTKKIAKMPQNLEADATAPATPPPASSDAPVPPKRKLKSSKNTAESKIHESK